MRRLLVLSAALVGILFTASSQSSTSTLDSLIHRLDKTPADTSRVLLLDQLSEKLSLINAAQSVRYGLEGLQLARQLHYKKGEVLLLNEIGDTYFFKEDLSNAARYYQQAVRRAPDAPGSGRLLTLALLGLGRVAVLQHDYPESQRYFHQVLYRIRHRLYKVLPKDISLVQNGLGVMYYDWLTSGKTYPDSVKRLGLYYSRLTLNTLKHGKSDASLAVALNGMGNIHRLDRRYDSAVYYHQAALRLFKRLNSPFEIAQTQVWLSAAMIAQHRSAKALLMLHPALATAKQLHLPALQADCSIELAAALAALDQTKQAYQLVKTGHFLLDSLQRADQKADLTRLRVQFNTEQEHNRVRELTHRTQLQALQARRQRYYFWWLSSLLVAVAGGLAASGTLAWRLRRQRTELIVTRAEQDRLYALIAHDLRSPVVAFSGLANLLTAYVERQDTARLMGLGGRVRQAAESLREQLDNLLNWALSQRGELKPKMEPVAVASLLVEISQLYQTTADISGVDLVIADRDTNWVLADRQMTLTILRNLVSNAFHATPAGGRIAVRAMATSNQEILLEVADTGQGISAEELARLMNESLFHTAERYRGRAGLGLRLSRLFAQIQGGQLTLRSASGQGTTATLALPCAKQ